METLLKQLRELPARLAAMPGRSKAILGAAGLMAVGLVVGAVLLTGKADSFQYAFTNLTPEDSAEAAQALKTAKVPYRLEAGGAALAVPADKVYEVRLLLATSGLPRGGGVGFELFDRGELGVSEFTQKINLRRAIEGELARTIGKLSEVRSARVHLSLSEKGLYRDEDRKASAAVVLNLQPGRALGERELAGIRHLAASAVPGLVADAVTIVDGRGSVLSGDSTWDDPSAVYQRKLERDLEQRVVSLLEPVVGQGSVIARVTVSADASQVTSSAEVFDPEQSALKSERKMAQSQNSNAGIGVVGAAANQPLQPLVPLTGTTGTDTRTAASTQDEVRNYEVSKTTTNTVARLPRVQRLSLAVLVDGADGKPRSDAEVERLGELARRAVGFDEDRGDLLEISSAVFTQSGEEQRAVARSQAAAEAASRWWIYATVALGVAAALALAFLIRRRQLSMAAAAEDSLLLRPGARVSEIESAELKSLSLPDPAIALQAKARELATLNPTKAAHLLRAWIATDTDQRELANG